MLLNICHIFPSCWGGLLPVLLIHVKTVLEVSRYFGKIYLRKSLGGCLIFKFILILELKFSYNPVLTAFESYGIFDSCALNVVSK